MAGPARPAILRALTERVIEYSTRAAGDWWHSGLGLQLSVNLAASGFSEHDWKLDAFVAKPESDDGGVNASLQQVHRAGMAKHMGSDVLVAE